MPFVEANGVRFFYQQKGSGADIVLVHAFTSSTAIWLFTNIIDTLATDYRVTAYDLRGHGSSEVPKDGYDSAQMARDFLAIHKKLNLENCCIVGHSYGGVIGVHAAVLQPEVIQGIIFSDTYFPGLKQLEPEMGQSEPWADLRIQMEKCDIEIGETVDFQRLFREVKKMTDEQKSILSKNMGPVGANWIGRLGSLSDTTAGRDAFEVAGLDTEKISSVSCPIFALYDEFSPFHKTREFLENNVKRIESAIVPKAKHLAPLQSTDEFVALVRRGIEKFHIQNAANNA